MSAAIIRADARHLPLSDASVDLIVTSPPYFALRDYRDGDRSLAGQIGAEPTPAAYVDALIACTREWMRVLKPQGSLWINLGDKYRWEGADAVPGLVPRRSLMLLPERYRIAAVDDLGLIARAVVIWSKTNPMPGKATDRVRTSHEDWIHLVRQPDYYAALDAIREQASDYARAKAAARKTAPGQRRRAMADTCNPLGTPPGSVWEFPSQPLTVPERLGVDHFAAFPPALIRRIVLGWSPLGICTACGEGRRLVSEVTRVPRRPSPQSSYGAGKHGTGAHSLGTMPVAHITGDACACPAPTARTRPAVVLDPFGGTGTTALVASAHGRHGISVDRSADYCRLAQWRTTDPGERARALGVPKPPPVTTGQGDLFDGEVFA